MYFTIACIQIASRILLSTEISTSKIVFNICLRDFLELNVFALLAFKSILDTFFPLKSVSQEPKVLQQIKLLSTHFWFEKKMSASDKWGECETSDNRINTNI